MKERRDKVNYYLDLAESVSHGVPVFEETMEQ